MDRKTCVKLFVAAGLMALLAAAAAVKAEAPTVVSKKHVVAYSQSGRFCGWPANNGIYIYGNEILAGFELGYYTDDGGLHHRDDSRPTYRSQIRSLDGGETWQPDPGGPPVPGNFSDDPALPYPAEGFNFGHPDFGYTSHGSDFHITYNRGRDWIPGPNQGAYLMAKAPQFFSNQIMTCRPRHLVNGPTDCMFCCSAVEDGGSMDRAYLARSTDGKTIHFVSWIGPGDGTRSVMPDAVRISNTKLLCALRRKSSSSSMWIDIYVSNNDGQSWQFLSEVVRFSEENGNPPSLMRMKDGRVVCAYGDRDNPSIRARVSEDEGTAWSDEIILRDDADGPDIGYCQTVQRPDGKIVTVYYYRTRQRPENFIGATIWELEQVSTADFNADGVINYLDFAIFAEDEGIF